MRSTGFLVGPASGLTAGRSAGFALPAGRLPGRVTLTGLSRFSDLKPPLSEGFAAGLSAGFVAGFAAGLVAGLATVVLGLRSLDELAEGRLTVPAGLVEAEGFAVAGCFAAVDGFAV